jgi:SET domain-containing protein
LAKFGLRAYCAAVPIDPRIRVYRSPIHGYGVVARRDFAAGEVIAEVDGILYREDELEDDRYCLWISDEFFLDMVDQTCWINHSCEPNADIEGELDGQGGAWAKVIASRHIRAGEEISYDYAFPQDLAERCSCGTPSCRGYIVDSDELPALLARLATEPLEPPPAYPSRTRQNSA